MLLDTGFEGRLLVAVNAIRQHEIETDPIINLPDRDFFCRLDDSLTPKWPRKVKLLMEGNQRVVQAEIINMRDFSGVIGAGLLSSRRITIDVIENGTVEVGRIPSPTSKGSIRSLFCRPERQSPYSDCPPFGSNLPWKETKVKDSAGAYHTLCANVDTGDNGELTLPPSEVEEFGFRFLGRCRLNVIGRQVNASCGEVEIVWQEESRTVQCRQRSDVDRPIIGMKLLSGNRITIDVGYPTKIVDISPIRQ